MTKQELIETIQAIENGLAMNPTGEMLDRLTNRLHRAKQKLEDIDQKKSDQQPAEKSEQLPTKTEMKDWAKEIDREQRLEQENKAAFFEEKRLQKSGKLPKMPEPGLFEFTKLQPVTAPQPDQHEIVVRIWLNKREDGKTVQELEEFTEAELRDYLQTYFVRIRDSESLKAGNIDKLLRGLMLPNLIGMALGWNEYKGVYPTLAQLTGKKRMNKQESERAELLYKMVIAG